MENNYYRVFNQQWFTRWQKPLLWLLNTPVVRTWFRRILRINGERSSVGKERITRIEPHAIHWQGSIEFRTHWKFSKRIYFAFKYVWWTLHAWDYCINLLRFSPKLNFGFDVLTVYPDIGSGVTTVDGYVLQTYAVGSGVGWATIIALADGTDVSLSVAVDTAMQIRSDTTSPNWRQLLKSFFHFDTSSIPDTNNISLGTLSLAGDAKADNASITPDINIYGSTTASDNNLVIGDFDQAGSTAFSTAIAYANLTTGGTYADFVLNASGLANISKTGVSKFSGRNANYDAAATAPTHPGSALLSYWNINMADQAGTTSDPKLVVTHAAAAVANQVAIGTSSSVVVAASLSGAATSRIGLTITNLSTGTVYLAFGTNAAVVGSGIPLLPSGGSWSMDDYLYTKEAVNGIAHNSNSLVSFQEFFN